MTKPNDRVPLNTVLLDEKSLRTLLEQYKCYVDSANKVSERRSAAHTLLLAANTTLIAVFGFVLRDGSISQGTDSFGSWLIPTSGLLLSASWFALIRSYRKLNEAKFAVIDMIDENFPLRLFALEWQQLSRNRHLSLSASEQIMPILFGSIYMTALVFVIS